MKHQLIEISKIGERQKLFSRSEEKTSQLPNYLSVNDLNAAIDEIKTWVGYGPMPLADLTDVASALNIGTISYKHEGPRFSLGSFKALGGAYAVLRAVQKELKRALGQNVSFGDIYSGRYAAEVKNITVVSATDGNHGRSVAWGAQRIGASCRIYIHAEVSPFREKAIAAYGAEVARVSGDYDDAVAQTKVDADENGWIIVSDTTWPGYEETPKDVMAGYGVIVDEVKTQLAEPPTHIFLQGGVGSFAAAMVLSFHHLWPEATPRYIVVEPLRAPCLFESAKAGRAVTAKVEEESIMAGLSCGEASPMAWDVLAVSIQDYLLIPDDVISPTIRMLAASEAGIKAGESGVAGLAALICAASDSEVRSRLNLDGDAHILLIGTEGVTDPELFSQIMAEEI